MDAPSDPSPAIGPITAGSLVFGTSAAVLVVELVALRLLAPYFGLTLETSTTVIGLALGAIALGSWLGGRLADAVPPRRTIGPAIGVSAGVVAVTPSLVRAVGEAAPGVLVLVAALTILVPGALLSAVSPMVTKLRLTALEETGRVVGRLSAIGTAGAIVGTVVTGFVLISRVPVSAIMVGLGVLLLLAALLVDLRIRGWGVVSRCASIAVVVAGGLGAVVGPGGCDAETTYHCAVVASDPDRPGGRVLELDGLRHSYVDLDDPTHLELAYVKALGAVTDATFDPGPLRAHHLGGGGLTLPRYLAAERPGTVSTVSEIDPGVVDLDVERLGLRTGPDLQVRVEDGRRGLGRLEDSSVELVVGDAFGGVSVPWHLTTREALTDVRRVLDDSGRYAANLIDNPPLAFARAEVATLAEVFDHVVVLAPPAVLARRDGGNLVAVASDAPIDPVTLQAALLAHDSDYEVLADSALTSWIDGAQVLRDDFAPVDQLLTPYRTSAPAAG